MRIASSGEFVDLRGQYLAQEPGALAILDIVNCENVTVLGGILDGLNTGSSDWGTDMYRHSIRVINSRNITIRQVEFRNPVCDAIILGVIDGQDQPSDGVTIEGCWAHGCGENRQFVSVISAYNVRIRDNYSRNMARPDQPGHIDIEPDRPDQACWNIAVERNVCDGGNARGIQVFNELANASIFGEIYLRRNTVRGIRDVGIACQGSAVVTEGRVIVEGNTVTGAAHPYYFSNMAVEHDGKKKRKRRKHR